MLLYDRLTEFTSSRKRLAEIDAGSRVTLSLLRRAPVYELSDVVCLFRDWESELAKRVPRRPPHPNLWTEWELTQPTTFGNRLWQVGNLSTWWDKAVALESMPDWPRIAPSMSSDEVDRIGTAYRKFIEASQELYLVRRFLCLLRDPVPADDPCSCPYKVPVLAVAPFVYLWALRDDGKEIRGHICSWEGRHGCKVDTPGFGLPSFNPFGEAVHTGELAVCPVDNSHHPLVSAWPAFMAFALLHCKNVVVEEHRPDGRLQRRVEKAGNPPRVTYKTLRIEVPKVCAERKRILAGADDSGPKVRFHLCSGHFKNLQHPRYKNKGWHWWPAHWKGSRALGRVNKTYSLESRP
jgi:hypothetical protein